MPSNILQSTPSSLGFKSRSGAVGMEDAVYVSTNESLAVMCISSVGMNPTMTSVTPPAQGVQLIIDMRMLTQNAGLTYLTFTVNPTNDYTCNEFFIKLPEGFILSATAYTSGLVQQKATGAYSQTELPAIGQTWVSLSVVISQNPDQYTGTFLCQGYCTNYQRVTYPIPQAVSYQDGYPFVRTSTVSSGGAYGAITKIYNVPINAINEITAVNFVLNTGADAANRQGTISVYKSVNTPGGNDPSVLIPFGGPTIGANTNIVFYAAIGIPFTEFTLPPGRLQNYTVYWAPLPNRLRLNFHDFIESSIYADAAVPNDLVRSITVWGNEWLMP
jgi:hypothetical protein